MHTIIAYIQKLGGKESNPDSWDQNPMSCQLDDPRKAIRRGKNFLFYICNIIFCDLRGPEGIFKLAFIAPTKWNVFELTYNY